MENENYEDLDFFDFANFAKSLEEIHNCNICLESYSLASNNLIQTCCKQFYCKTCYITINNCRICRNNLKNQFHHLQNQLEQNQQMQNPINVSLHVDYVYLSTDERRQFAQNGHEYLIDQIQFT